MYRPYDTSAADTFSDISFIAQVFPFPTISLLCSIFNSNPTHSSNSNIMAVGTKNPPRSASTKCKVAPPSSWYSEAVLSSDLEGLCVSEQSPKVTEKVLEGRRGKQGWGEEGRGEDVHLFPTEYQSLLDRWDTLFLFDLFFDL
jgi:hypothetical protein